MKHDFFLTAIALTASFLLLQPTIAAERNSALTPEEEKVLYELLLKKAGGGSPAKSQPEAPKPTEVGSKIPADEREMAKKISQLPRPQGRFEFTDQRDGFLVNGVRYVDAEGTIINYRFDIFTGDVGYVVKTPSNKFLVKTVRVETNTEPITLATAESVPKGWDVKTITGKSVAGDSLVPLPMGFMVGRASAGFRYTAGVGLSNFSVPEEYALTNYQNGDIAGTQYVLLERVGSGKKGGLGELVESFNSLAAPFGIGKTEDYVLLNVVNGSRYPFNIDKSGKQVITKSNCTKVNAIFNECKNISSHEALFDEMGRPNSGHYFWKISWYKTPSGPIVVAQENSYKDITITDLVTGKKVVAFHRTLGIANFSVDQEPDGVVSIKAQLAFDHVQLDDARKFLDNTEAPASAGSKS